MISSLQAGGFWYKSIVGIDIEQKRAQTRCQIKIWGGTRPLGKVTKNHEVQLVVIKNALKVDNGLRVSRPNPKGAGDGLGLILALVPTH